MEAIRALRVARSSAVKVRSQTLNQLEALLVAAPAELREKLRALSTTALIATCAALRLTIDLADPEQATMTALRRLARRHQHLSQEITDADGELHALITAAAPQLLRLRGVGLEVAGQILTTVGGNRDRLRSEAAFAHLCGVAPIPAISGRVQPHRPIAAEIERRTLALYVAVVSRLRHDPRTRDLSRPSGQLLVATDHEGLAPFLARAGLPAGHATTLTSAKPARRADSQTDH